MEPFPLRTDLPVGKNFGAGFALPEPRRGGVGERGEVVVCFCVFSAGELTAEAADELFAVARARMMNAPEWTEFFVEMITDHVVWQARPTGVVSDAQAEWLVKRADECKTVEALAALVNVLAEAHRAPEWFVAAVKARASGGW